MKNAAWFTRFAKAAAHVCVGGAGDFGLLARKIQICAALAVQTPDGVRRRLALLSDGPKSLVWR